MGGFVSAPRAEVARGPWPIGARYARPPVTAGLMCWVCRRDSASFGDGSYRPQTRFGDTAMGDVMTARTGWRRSRFVFVLAVVGLAAMVSGCTVVSTISVSGNHLQGANGSPTRLLGVNRSGTEYACAQ